MAGCWGAVYLACGVAWVPVVPFTSGRCWLRRVHGQRKVDRPSRLVPYRIHGGRRA
ncbi:hypothetical protein PR003_g9857 [Phytophthora rubi]|uniref:Uncharacterized protein n=1 Tax=Phytophthora rubi TaxID=129364 RepID=A0A6A3MDI0_9STRA|nr:hypothetical protein PR001_g11932 [Phytophthora rubi]KAE9031604.1 hypothetical protein PR002_g9615 [Phytophthora rubi]KAE9341694.1 hypothetical protein PR003_g9857 [Phytophthora rubi]